MVLEEYRQHLEFLRNLGSDQNLFTYLKIMGVTLTEKDRDFLEFIDGLNEKNI